MLGVALLGDGPILVDERPQVRRRQELHEAAIGRVAEDLLDLRGDLVGEDVSSMLGPLEARVFEREPLRAPGLADRWCDVCREVRAEVVLRVDVLPAMLGLLTVPIGRAVGAILRCADIVGTTTLPLDVWCAAPLLNDVRGLVRQQPR